MCTVHCEHPLRKCALQISNQRPPYISAASLALTTIQPPLPGIAFRYHPKHNQMPFSQIAGHFEDLQIYRILNSLRKGLLTPQYESQITQKWTFDTTIWVASPIYTLLSAIRQQMSPFDPFRGGGLRAQPASAEFQPSKQDDRVQDEVSLITTSEMDAAPWNISLLWEKIRFDLFLNILFLPDPGVSGVRSMGSRVCTSLHTSNTFLKLCRCDSGGWWYQLNSRWWCH